MLQPVRVVQTGLPRGALRVAIVRVGGHERVWDCACGNGQASVDLAGYFRTVYGTDLSAEQIAHAEAHPRVNYRVGLAEDSGHRIVLSIL